MSKQTPSPATPPGKSLAEKAETLIRAGINKAGAGPLLFKYAGPLVFKYHEWRVAKSTTEVQDPIPEIDEHGLPIPSRFLMTLVAGHSNWQRFLTSGETHSTIIADLIERNGGRFKNAKRVLDMGCGCGRIARHVPRISDAELFGVDYNPTLSNWCSKNLPGHFTRNKLTPPLNFPDQHFDAIWLLSVFTHLRIETQNQWLQEFHRVLRPGGIVVITYHDEKHPGLELINFSEEQLIKEETHIFRDQAEGSNYIATFQSSDFARKQFGKLFEVCEMIPSCETELIQAAAVLRRR